MQDAAGTRIAAALAAAADPSRVPAGAIAPHAVGWGTVDMDRAVLDLAGDLGIAPEAFVDGVACQALGARCRVAERVLLGGLSLAMLEPATEGRLAATLARLGEGPAVVWYATDAASDAGPIPWRPGPFGLERLVPGDPVHGPHRLLIRPGAGTIAP